MTDTGYKKVLSDAIARAASINARRQELETELSKIRQFISATLNMLPDEERMAFVKAMDQTRLFTTAQEEGLKATIIRTLLDAYPRWMTAAQVRDAMVDSGFDFSSYASNPLASVSTTLRRMKPKEVEAFEVEGVMSYRRKPRKISRAEKIAMEGL